MKPWSRKKEQFTDHELKNVIHAPSSEKTRIYCERVRNNQRLTIYLGKRLNKLFEGKKNVR